ncbi:MAG: proteasome-activating nucleotidase [Candidatus Hodarchaeales archaeon]
MSTFRGRTPTTSDSYYRALERNLKTLESEQKRLIRQRNSLQKQLEEAKKEISKLTKEPLLIGTLVEIFDNKERAIVRSSSGPSFVVNVASDIDFDEMTPGKRVVLNQRTFSLIRVISSSIDPLVRGMEIEERPDISYKDIGGLETQIKEVQESIELSLKHPELFNKVGIESPKGVLLFGPPGSGKTLIAKAVAHETNATFISIVGSEFVQKYIGEGARLVRELFQYARKKAPAIIFIDELDAIGAQRLDIATGGDREVQRTFMQLLSEMDGFSARGNIKIIGATNRVDILDPALLRAGRFDRHVEIPAPNEEGREEIFKIHTQKMNLDGISYKELSILSDGLNGAEIKAVCTEAGMEAIRERRTSVTFNDFVNALPKVNAKKEQITSGKDYF